jgi:hypothetical protein
VVVRDVPLSAPSSCDHTEQLGRGYFPVCFALDGESAPGPPLTAPLSRQALFQARRCLSTSLRQEPPSPKTFRWSNLAEILKSLCGPYYISYVKSLNRGLWRIGCCENKTPLRARPLPSYFYSARSANLQQNGSLETGNCERTAQTAYLCLAPMRASGS